jgi:hypothetical protein
MRFGISAFIILAFFGATTASAGKAFARAQASVKSAAHDDKAHAIWASENRKRWRKGLKHHSNKGMKMRIEVLEKSPGH